METIIPIIRSQDIHVIEKTVNILLEVGFKTFEITTNYENVFEYVSKLNDSNPELNIGVGSVITEEHFENITQNNIKFVVTPGFDYELVKGLVERKIPVYVGCLTPSEVSQAINLGADVIKIFPANTMPKNYAKSLKAPFPTGKFIAVGGVSIDNYRDYLDKGYDGFGFSSDMMKIANMGDWEELRNLLMKYKEIQL